MPRLASPAALSALLLTAPLAAETVTTVVVVRHAEKAADQGSDPHLTEAGRARAELLADLLEVQPIGGLYSSEYHRTRETLVPLSQRRGVGIVTIGARETAATLTAERLLTDHAGQTVVIASHSNLVPEIVEALTGESVAEIDESIYDDLFVVSVHADGSAHALRLKYGEPPS
jgi:2,3-bisphosphoglycerate-dependent phosphoglycerate mutase